MTASQSLLSSGNYRGRAENPGTNLYVTGLSTRVTEEDLEKLFSKEGKVRLVTLLLKLVGEPVMLRQRIGIPCSEILNKEKYCSVHPEQ